MLNYWRTAQDENLNMYSVDMVRVNLEMREDEVNNILNFFTDIHNGMIPQTPFQEYTTGHEKRGVE